jgi:hypothetical protein
VDHLAFCTEIKTLLMSEIVTEFYLQPPKNLPDHSILKGTFITSFYQKNAKQNYPGNFPRHIPINNTSGSRPPKPNLKKMPLTFFMTNKINEQVIHTNERIEKSLKTQNDIDLLWSEIKTMLTEQLEKLPTLPAPGNKKQKQLFRKSQPFWNDDLTNLWKIKCHAENCFTSYKVRTNQDLHHKSLLRDDFKNKQKSFDIMFRQAKRKSKKQNLIDLEKNAVCNPNSMWATLKKLSDPPSTKAVLEIVRADETISRDIKEILEKWQLEISKLFSGIRENPEMAFDDDFFQ